MRAVVRCLSLLFCLVALIPGPADAQGRRRARGSTSETALAFDDVEVQSAVLRPRLDANALFGASARATPPSVGRARRALGLLARGDRDGALQQLSGLDPAIEAVEVAYVIAWARFSTGDFAGAAAALGPTLRRARVAQLDTLRTELAWMNTYAGSGLDELRAQLGDERAVHAVAERMVEPLLAHGELERAGSLLEWLQTRLRGVQLATALEHEARVDFARGSPNVGAIRLAEAVAIARSAGDASALASLRARALEAAERADRAWTQVRDARSRIAATVLYRVWLRSGAAGPQAAAIERTVAAIERPPTTEPAAGIALAPVRAAIDLRSGDVRGCYARALAVEPTLRGRVVLRFTVTPTGDVTDAAVASAAAGLEDAAACVASRAGTWRLPPASRTSTVAITYPFVLSPEG